MDAVAETKAALGNEQRDAMSNFYPKGRLAEAEHFERKDQQRRNKAHNEADANKGDERSAKISAWNQQEIFGSDSMVEGLANHFSGQGHREELMSSMGHQQHHPPNILSQGQFHFGSGGRRIQANGAHAPPATSSLSNGAQGSRQAGPSLPPGLPKSVPASAIEFAKAKPLIKAESRTVNNASTERPPVSQTSTTTRPYQVATASGAVGTPIRIARTAATAGTVPSVRIAASNGTFVRTSATAPSPIHSTMRTSSPASGTRSSATTTATMVRVLHAAVPETPTAAPKVDYFRDVMYVKMAELYAAKPGLESDTYYEKFPERLPYLAKALEELAEKKSADEKGPADEVNDTGSGVEAEKSVEEAAQKVVEIKEAMLVKETASKEKAPETIKKETADKAAIGEKKIAPKTIEKETTEEVSEAKVPHYSSERQSHKPTRQESISSVGSLQPSVATADSRLSILKPATPASPQMPMYGTLVATYLDHTSSHLSTHKTNVNAPVQANIQITSTSAEYDPRNLNVAFSVLVKMMSMKNPNILLKRRDDGLWQANTEVDDDL